MAVKAVVLLSGGMDSAVAAALARSRGRRLAGLSLDYGQRHALELRAARRQARAFGLERHVVLKLPLKPIAAGALLDGGRLNTRGPRRGKPATYVSFRNGVFLAAAASLAEAWGASELWGGWGLADQGGYPDCSPAFFRAFERAVRSGTWAGRRGRPFAIRAPLLKLDKAGILRLGLRLRVDFADSWSCYAPRRGRPCGRCEACRLRGRAFRAAGLPDPLLA